MPIPIQPKTLAGPYRRPEWRHDQASKLTAEGRLSSHRLHDEQTRMLTAFYQRLHQYRTDFDIHRVYRSAPTVTAAYRLFKAGQDGAREAVKGMVLAREPAAHIAELVGLKPEAVTFFEDGFFDVRSRLDKHEFVLNQVIGINRKPRSEEELLFKAMHFYAYLAGPLSLEVFRFYVSRPVRWQHISEVLEDIELRARALLQFTTVGPDGQVSQNVSRELMKLLEWNRENKGRFGDENGCRNPRELRRSRIEESLTPPQSWYSSKSPNGLQEFLGDV